MKYSRSSDIICLGDNRQAALYFDRVLPINASDIYLIESDTEFTFLTTRSEKILQSLLALPGETVPSETLNEVFASTSNLLCLTSRLERKTPVYSQLCDSLTKAYSGNVFFPSGEELQCNPFAGQTVRSVVSKIADSTSLKNPSIILRSDFAANEIGTDEDVSLTISNIPLVDTRRASWEQIIEFRKDKDARAKLRNLRLFIHANYDGKSRAFIEDDMAKRLDEYHKTCKEFGFETITSVLSTITNSKNIRVGAIGSLAAFILGEPFVASIAAITGGSIEVGNLCIELAKKKYNYDKFKNDHDLAYIIEARNKFGDGDVK